jgi:hypothetical protein
LLNQIHNLKKDTTSIAKQSSRGAGNYPDYKKAETRVDGTLIKGRSNAQRITPFSPAQGNRAKTTEEMLRDSDTRGYKAGGRAGYKHGGSTGSSKSSGAAKRGISPILMKGEKIMSNCNYNMQTTNPRGKASSKKRVKKTWVVL